MVEVAEIDGMVVVGRVSERDEIERARDKNEVEKVTEKEIT